MERRNFLRSILGVAAATALPSEVWPFRKIFLPPVRRVTIADIEAVQYRVYTDSIAGINYYALPIREGLWVPVARRI